MSAYTHLDQFKRQARMSTWATTILINSARMKLRRHPRRANVALSDHPQDYDTELFLQMLRDHRPNPEEVTQRNELTERAVRFATQLSPTLRRVYQLRDVCGLSIRDTANILGVPNGTVKAQVARARAKLKVLMQNSVGRKRKRNLGFRSKWRQGIHVIACCSSQTRAVSVPQIRSLVPQEAINGAGQISAQTEVSRSSRRLAVTRLVS